MFKVTKLITSGMIALLATSSIPLGIANAKSVSNKKSNSNVVTIYLARHGQTTGNVLTLNEGWDDYPLTPKGEQVAKEVGAGLRGIKFNYAAAGKLVRHLDTIKDMLDYSGNSNVVVRETPLLREAGEGKYELYNEKQSDELLNKYFHVSNQNVLVKKFGIDYVNKTNQALYEISKKHDTLPKADRAESAKQIINREAKGIKQVADATAKKNGKNALVVSSGDIIAAYLSKYDKHMSKADKKLVSNDSIPNSGVTKVYYNVKTNKVSFGKVGDLSYVNKGTKYLKNHKVKESKFMTVQYEK
ncbi:histidine phosphatase family protein [Lactobacillus sp. Sy-1]|uniref:histidine phosphatase family protein n=1 Tax=Lactobacillus sp. Sy-1 TaxID=2109645 RepID=UPI001C5A9A6A|nr:phosphoglycerate mutase family protein [Lactobacillus sp. Sy-1]MBW1606328.1 phosphoglycerate mutase family protein [Lactobacillus sp. Sy-1]